MACIKLYQLQDWQSFPMMSATEVVYRHAGVCWLCWENLNFKAYRQGEWVGLCSWWVKISRKGHIDLFYILQCFKKCTLFPDRSSWYSKSLSVQKHKLFQAMVLSLLAWWVEKSLYRTIRCSVCLTWILPSISSPRAFPAAGDGWVALWVT